MFGLPQGLGPSCAGLRFAGSEKARHGQAWRSQGTGVRPPLFSAAGRWWALWSVQSAESTVSEINPFVYKEPFNIKTFKIFSLFVS